MSNREKKCWRIFSSEFKSYVEWACNFVLLSHFDVKSIAGKTSARKINRQLMYSMERRTLTNEMTASPSFIDRKRMLVQALNYLICNYSTMAAACGHAVLFFLFQHYVFVFPFAAWVAFKWFYWNSLVWFGSILFCSVLLLGNRFCLSSIRFGIEYVLQIKYGHVEDFLANIIKAKQRENQAIYSIHRWERGFLYITGTS